jgi:hypothetical protein
MMSARMRGAVVGAAVALLCVVAFTGMSGGRESRSGTTARSTTEGCYNVAVDASFPSVVAFNRASLRQAPTWEEDAAMRASIFRYGIPGFYKPGELSWPIDDNATVPDTIAWTALQLRGPVRYLEIGVSVGKTLYQMMHFLGPRTVVVAMDLENINPPLERLLVSKQTVSSYVPDDYLRRGRPSGASLYRGLSGQDFYYLTTDEFDARGWAHLVGLNQTFNLIFSDAMHKPTALAYEWERIRDLGLLPIRDRVTPWYMLWDDLLGDMMPAYERIVDDCRKHAAAAGVTVYGRVVKVNGWVGQHETFKHPIGVMSNQPLDYLDAVDAYNLVSAAGGRRA